MAFITAFKSPVSDSTPVPRISEGSDRCFALMRSDGPGELMAEQCFKLQYSNPPICGVHNVPLIRRETPIDPLAPRLGRISYLICPTSELVVHDPDENRPRDRT
jgi:hypothetical protein